MARAHQTKEDYLISSGEFKTIIDEWVRLYNKTSLLFGAATTTNFFRVGKCLERGSVIFDGMMFKDFPCLSLHTRSIENYFYSSILAVNPRYIHNADEKTLECPDLGKTIPLCMYSLLATDLKSYSEYLSKFVIDLQKYHGKTKIRVLLDSTKYITDFYFELESRMYREYENCENLSDVF